jgi:hypothetical protein
MTLPSSRLAILTPMAAAPWWPPRTAAEAKQECARRNRAAARERAQRDQAHEARRRQLEQTATAGAAAPRATPLPAERSELCQAACYAAGTDLCDQVACWAKRLGADARRAPGPRLDVAAVYRERNRKGGLR